MKEKVHKKNKNSLRAEEKKVVVMKVGEKRSKEKGKGQVHIKGEVKIEWLGEIELDYSEIDTKCATEMQRECCSEC